MQADAGIALVTMPVAPVPDEVAELRRNLLNRRFHLLQAQHIRPLTADPVQHLLPSSPNSVDVPGRDLEHRRRAFPAPGHEAMSPTDCAVLRGPVSFASTPCGRTDRRLERLRIAGVF